MGLRVFELAPGGQQVHSVRKINLAGLTAIPTDEQAAQSADGLKFAEFINEFRRRELTPDQKIERVRTAPAWNPAYEVTSTDWVLTRLDSVVQAIFSDVVDQVTNGVLADATSLPQADHPVVEKELRELDKRLGSTDTDAAARNLSDYVAASPRTTAGLAMQQFLTHTAFYTATKLLLVRAWEDSELIDPSIYDGGFDKMMEALASVSEVVELAYTRASNKYPELFRRHNAFSWYKPSEEVYIDTTNGPAKRTDDCDPPQTASPRSAKEYLPAMETPIGYRTIVCQIWLRT